MNYYYLYPIIWGESNWIEDKQTLRYQIISHQKDPGLQNLETKVLTMANVFREMLCPTLFLKIQNARGGAYP